MGDVLLGCDNVAGKGASVGTVEFAGSAPKKKQGSGQSIPHVFLSPPCFFKFCPPKRFFCRVASNKAARLSSIFL